MAAAHGPTAAAADADPFVTDAVTAEPMQLSDALLRSAISPAEPVRLSRMDRRSSPSRQDVLEAQAAWARLPQQNARKHLDARYLTNADGAFRLRQMVACTYWTCTVYAGASLLGPTKASLDTAVLPPP